MLISEVIDVKKYDPANDKLSAFIGQKIKILSFKSTKTLSKDKNGNVLPALEITFDDQDGNRHTYKTAAKNLVKQLVEVFKKTNFPKTKDKIDSIDGWLCAEKVFGKLRNYYLSGTEPNTSVKTRDEDNEEYTPTPNVEVSDENIEASEDEED